MKGRLKGIFTIGFSDPEEILRRKLEVAEELYENWREYFARDSTFNSLLLEYESAVKKANEVMEEIKSFEECYICSVEERKGCCKAGLENEVTINIILINKFLNKEIPSEREIPGRCFFVGERGCKIFARPYLCREFFCRRLQEKFKPEEYVKVTNVVAKELTLLYQACEYIKKNLEFLLGEFIMEIDLTGYS